MKSIFSTTGFRSPERLLVSLLGGYVVFLSLLNVLAIGFSVIHIPLNRFSALVILGCSMLGGYACAIASRRCENVLPPLASSTPRLIRNVLLLGVAICFAAFMILWAVSLLTLDCTWDGNTYHTPTMSLWAQKARIHWIAPEIECNWIKYMNGYAKAGEVVGFVMALALGNFFSTTINCMFLPLGILGIAVIALSLRASPTAAVFAGMLFVLVPVNVWQTPTTYIDTAFAACVIAFFAFLYRYLELTAIGNNSAESWFSSLLLGASLGLMLGVKGNGAWMSGMIFASLFAAGLFFIYRWMFFRCDHNEREQRRRFAARWFAQIGLMLTACLLVGGYWYARNCLLTRNPLYPIVVKIAGKELLPGIDYKEFLDRNTPPEWHDKSMATRVASAWSQQWNFREAWAQGPRKGGLGFFWILGCLPAILCISLSRMNQTARDNVARSGAGENQGEKTTWVYWVLFGTAIVFFLFTPANWWSRYTIWIYGIGLPCFAVLLTWLTRPLAALTMKAAERRRFSAFLALSQRDGCTNVRFHLNLPWSWRKLGALWIAACVLLMFVEGFLSIKAMSSRQWELPKPWNSIESNLCVYLYPELSGTEIPRIINEGRRIAVSVLDYRKREGNPGFFMLGICSQPLEARRWGVVDRYFNETSLKKLQSGQFEYLIWDSEIPLPEQYAPCITLEKSYPDFIALYRITAPGSASDDKSNKR